MLARLVPDGIRPGTIFTVEFDPDSQWLALSTTIAAKYLQAGGRVGYGTATRPPESVRENLTNLGVDVLAAIKEYRLVIDDWYAATLTGGRIDAEPAKTSLIEPIDGGARMRSLKVADLSVEWLKGSKDGWQPGDLVETWPPGALTIAGSVSEMLRFNEEKPFLAWAISRGWPNERKAKRIHLTGTCRGAHTEWLYNWLEAAADGIIDVHVMERGDMAKSFLRIRSLKNQPSDSRWHEIEVKSNGEAELVN
jgi:KaiC/GvpD/RAD55 family RecA-like ATPase